METLLPKQNTVNYGALICPYTNKALNKTVVDAYNKYTEEFNNAKSRTAQEFFLDQRHKYLNIVLDENLNNNN